LHQGPVKEVAAKPDGLFKRSLVRKNTMLEEEMARHLASLGLIETLRYD